MSLVKRQWTTKPSYRVGLDQTNPTAKKLSLCHLMQQGTIDLVRGDSLAPISSAFVYPNVTNNGQVLQVVDTGASSETGFFSDDFLDTDGHFTLIFKAFITGTDAAASDHWFTSNGDGGDIILRSTGTGTTMELIVKFLRSIII